MIPSARFMMMDCLSALFNRQLWLFGLARNRAKAGRGFISKFSLGLLLTGCALGDPRVAFETSGLEPGAGGKADLVYGKTGLKEPSWTRPQLIYHADGDRTTFKRYERYPQRDFFHHCFRKVYGVPGENFRAASPDQEVLLEEWGPPDYVRRRFESNEDERVDEWAYLDEFRIFQFVKGEIVYEGPLTDYEQTLMRYGFPDRMSTLINEQGRVVHAFVYKSVILPYRLFTFYFSNDAMIHTAQGI